MKFNIVTLVGPGEAELERLDRLLRSVFLFSSNVAEVVLIDDELHPRGLEKLCHAPPGVRVNSLVHERKGDGPGILGGMCMGMLQALRHLSKHAPQHPVLKIDTDALVIAPFEEKIERLLQRETNLGTAGAVELNCDGSTRDWEPYGGVTKELAKLFRLQRHKLLRRRITSFGRDAAIRLVVGRARRQGYRWGEHSQGGSYLISSLLIQRMRELGFLSHGKAWLKVFMSEDAMMGLYARACGLRNVHCGGKGEVFGVSHTGLPFTPKELLDRGYSIIHSTKNNSETEADLFEFFCGSSPRAELEARGCLQPLP